MEINDKTCIELFTKNGRPFIGNNYHLIENNPEIKKYLENRYTDSDSIKETIYRILHNLECRPTCKTCGKKVNFNKTKNSFSCFCSAYCSNNDKDKIELTKRIKKELYGDEKYNNKEKARKTCIDRYGVDSFAKTEEFLTKVKKTNIEKYGVQWSLSNKEQQEKAKKTKIERYSDPNYNNREKAVKTSLERYGVENAKQTEQAKQKEKETCLKKYGVTSYSKTDECKQKHIDTYMKRFGVTHNTKSEEWKKKWYGNNEWVKNRNNRIYEKMKQNNSFNHSIPEDKVYHIIKEKYPNVIRQYKDENRYPFNCDFYIPDIDVFIEYDGYWTHGGHDFDKNNKDDVEKLNKWRSKENKLYETAIRVWTIDDPQKRLIAKKNNLKYIVLQYADYKSPDVIFDKINKVK